MKNFLESKNLAGALAKAQGEIHPPKKNKTNPFLHNKYADIASIIDAIRKPLAENGLSLLQLPHINGNMVTITTIVLHESGESIETSLTMEAENLGKGEVRKAMTIQSFAGSISYVRRYALQTILCIAADDDDDGETGRQPQTQPYRNQRPVSQNKPQPPQRTKSEQIKSLYEAIETLTEDRNWKHSEASYHKHLGVKDPKECDDPRKLFEYYEHIVKKMESEFRDPITAGTFRAECESKSFKKAMAVYRKEKAAQVKAKSDNKQLPEYTVEQLDDMMKVVEEKTPDKLDDFVNASDSKLYAVCQRIYEEANIKNTKIISAEEDEMSNIEDKKSYADMI